MLFFLASVLAFSTTPEPTPEPAPTPTPELPIFDESCGQPSSCCWDCGTAAGCTLGSSDSAVCWDQCSKCCAGTGEACCDDIERGLSLERTYTGCDGFAQTDAGSCSDKLYPFEIMSNLFPVKPLQTVRVFNQDDNLLRRARWPHPRPAMRPGPSFFL
ncbi:hypothetical protein EMIHUDRAFT_238509 [Emiliania huxleyi CCMP1516]|uniref:SMB domain-containing protein n=2 Tax=Emiliania huxleyi TaxID=2903 RepID=A0A0D3JLS6_EMIH1|nr:hypothetical protein EMIHUDRAFT_238509 [Emiliania huxleyi CCMP1516]EOD24461.1 hypothetical protein EMIHUDRAFT_238509 [Emiliania huxleyi CCMP1516]|eukprot:XP_005776890.1 hypothetical protein EMIHUDRAFT_238509 [Emiliania huxleyi CCMP1516]